MDKSVAQLVKEMRPGYQLEPVPRRTDAGGGYFYVVSPDGERALQPGGRPIVLHKADSPKSLQRLRGQLMRSGAIPPRVKSHRPSAPAAPSVEAVKLPYVLAAEILRAPDASPRERSLAKEVLRLREQLDGAQDEITRLKEFGRLALERVQATG